MEPPKTAVQDDGSVVHWFADGIVTMVFRDIRKGGPGYEAKCSIYLQGRAIDHVRIDLLSQQNRHFVVNSLQRHVVPVSDWDWLQAFVFSAEAMQRYFAGGTELVDLRTIIPKAAAAPLIDPIIEDTIVVWAGHGGIYKSVLSLLAVHQLTTGIPILGGSHGSVRNCLILDYEEPTPDTAARRARLIERRHPTHQIDGLGRVWYRNEMMPITSTAPTIRRLLDEHNIEFVVIDSLGVARGGAAESSYETIAAMDAIRSLGRAVLVLDHLKQDDGQGSGQDRPFGSVYTRNLARALWTIKRAPDSLNAVEFTHRKANHRRIMEGTVNYEVQWDSAAISASRVGFEQQSDPVQDFPKVLPMELIQHFSQNVS